MADLFDYLDWRGDLPFTQVPPNAVDALVFSALSYLDFAGIVPDDAAHPIPLHVAAAVFLGLANVQERIRVKSDLTFLEAAANTLRFRNTQLAFYRSKLIPEEETQFAAVTFLLEDGTAYLAFRGTDSTLVGWKEDFNMSFQNTVPAQREALAYTKDVAGALPVILRLGGHSKGGNLAVFSAAKSPLNIQKRILEVFNLDGPGFTDYLMGDEGYIRMVPKIRTYIPESSIIGILLEHEEPYTVIRSRQVGPLQHEIYSWEIMAGSFLTKKEISSGSRFIDRTVKNWIADMSTEQRSAFVEAMFDLISSGGASNVGDLLQPKNIQAIFHTLNTNDQTRKLLSGEFLEFLKAAAGTLLERS